MSDKDKSADNRDEGKSSKGKHAKRDIISDPPRHSALEVSVDNNIDKAMKILKRKLIKEGLFKELKLRRYYEKPSEKKKRKLKESLKKIRKEEARMKKNPYLYY